ncbi:hypothetical protein BO79DRAFT_238328 [Aspergillus costaricaensis CBS 115574]|uniref:Uncharacterized protein n=1 Tax=Aspergillus costaricaensis CBS 115574 TaxID=1448317 RepID=A0ACD1IBD7_9EURO|nr:hypothetical protein BO79DRAFT_238328 [Aspergillus costaricaensis CBS 115574]RAK87899.1 hypothetical protein BO79DRAFT_238328 [Aspergillus costaricaensis CBS 115574]
MDYWETHGYGRLSDSTRKISCQLATVHVLPFYGESPSRLPATTSEPCRLGRKFLADWRMRGSMACRCRCHLPFQSSQTHGRLRLTADSIQEKRSAVHRYRLSFPSSQTDYLSDYHGYACFDQRVFSISTGGGKLSFAP